MSCGRSLTPQEGGDYCCGICSESFHSLRKLGDHSRKCHKKKKEEEDFMKEFFEASPNGPAEKKMKTDDEIFKKPAVPPLRSPNNDMFKPLDEFLQTVQPDPVVVQPTIQPEPEPVQPEPVVQPAIQPAVQPAVQPESSLLNAVPTPDGCIVVPKLTLKIQLCQVCIPYLCQMNLPDGSAYYNIVLCPKCVKNNQ